MKKKISIRFLLIAAVAIVVTAGCAMFVYYNILKEQIFSDLKAYAHVVKQLDVDVLSDEITDGKYNPWLDELRITLVDSDGNVIYESLANKDEMDNHKARPEIEQALNTGEGEAVRYSATLGMHTFYYAQQLEDGSVLRIGRDSVSVNSIMVNTICIILTISVLVFILCTLLSHFLTKRLVRPIEELADNIVRVDEAQVYEEIRPFVTTIKEQHLNIINNAQMRQEFTANVSHELKTPLTAISGYAELIGNGMAGADDTSRFAKEIHRNANRLLTLINDIIKLSELDEAEIGADFESFDLYEITRDCMSDLEVAAENSEVSLALSGETTMVRANKGLIDELIYNLCSNAIRYNKTDGSVTVTVGTKEGKAFLRVEDTGIGIPKDAQARVFERFYRVDKSHSKSTGGTGLGLAIVKHIVAAHNAEITLTSELNKGTCMEVTF